MLRETVQQIQESKLVTLVIKFADGRSLVPENMKDNKGYPEYTAKKDKSVKDLIASHGLEEEDGDLVLKEVGDQRISYYTKRLTSNFEHITKEKIKVSVK